MTIAEEELLQPAVQLGLEPCPNMVACACPYLHGQLRFKPGWASAKRLVGPGRLRPSTGSSPCVLSLLLWRPAALDGESMDGLHFCCQRAVYLQQG